MSPHHRCGRCGSQYMLDLPKKDGEGKGRCSTALCWAIETWGPEEWEGQARMAENRKACGVPLNAVDIEALHRARTN